MNPKLDSDSPEQLYQVGIDASQLGEKPIVLEKNGEPIATVVSYQDFRTFQEWQARRHADASSRPGSRSQPTMPPLLLSDQDGVTPAVRLQILGTEHWNLLATRSLMWNEIFSRAGIYLTLLSAATVALALVAQASGFGSEFRRFALLLLPVVLFVGIVTHYRLNHANIADLGLVLGMNRLRHAYLEIAPELEPYFVTGHHDDLKGLQQSFGLGTKFNLLGLLSGTAELVGVTSAILAGIIAALIAETLGTIEIATIVIGVVVAIVAAALFAARTAREFANVQREYKPGFARKEHS